MLQQFITTCSNAAQPQRALQMQRFFKTKPGEYGEGDVFIGISVPQQRLVAKQFASKLSLFEFETLLHSHIHEHRLTCLFMLVLLYKSKKPHIPHQSIYELYMSNTQYINNWDLVDSSAHHIVGAHLENCNRDILFERATSPLLWDNRIAIISCFWFIRKHDFVDTFVVADLLLNHKHDLIHKAVGWMLREIGNRNFEAEYTYLQRTYRQMPRTMLRYAIEKFDEPLRQDFLKGFVI